MTYLWQLYPKDAGLAVAGKPRKTTQFRPQHKMCLEKRCRHIAATCSPKSCLVYLNMMSCATGVRSVPAVKALHALMLWRHAYEARRLVCRRVERPSFVSQHYNDARQR